MSSVSDRRPTRSHTTAFLSALIVALAAGGLADTAVAQRVVADFNGDGIDDLAVGAPNANSGRGSVSIFFGTNSGFPTAPSLTRSGVEAGEQYGAALAAADFNRTDSNARFQLVVGAPGWGVIDFGRIEVVQFLGPASSLTTAGLTITQNTRNVTGSFGERDRFGAALAVGDFNGDDNPDLAIGVPGDTEPGKLHAGAVNVLYGNSRGLAAAGSQLWHQGSDGISGSPEADDRFGSTLAVGDFNGDGRDDLAIGVPLEDLSYANQGSVNIIFGSHDGLSSGIEKLLMPLNTADTTGGQYGLALAGGDFNRDGYDDLAVGVPFGKAGTIRPGLVRLYYGTADPEGMPARPLYQGSDTPENGDFFGGALAAADFNGDGFVDLAVGAPDETVNGRTTAGAVNVYYGQSALGFATVQFLHQDSFHIRDSSEKGDLFGSSLATGDFNGDGLADLAIGIPFEDVSSNTVVNAGAVALVAGSALGITPEGNQLLLAGARQANAWFGLVLQR